MRSTIGNAVSRRQFLRGIFRKKTDDIRPPWSLPEKDFLNTCTRCKECIDKCPENIIVKGSDGFPAVDFSLGACTFCKECVDNCEPGALLFSETEQPWNICATVSDECLSMQGVTCRSCGDSCEQEAILFSPQLGGISEPATDAALCIGCGSCVAVCPVKAITLSENKLGEDVNNEHN